MNTPEAIGWVVRAFEDAGVRQLHHQQQFLFKDHGAEAEVKARKHHKHIRDLYPESFVELAHVFAPVDFPKVTVVQ
jgi:hypothetical protein